MNKRYENNDTNLKKNYIYEKYRKYIIIYISKKGLREESHGELMMRMMRKMFKRIVSIVMALLVILGTAVYGGSVFAEEQADSASVTFSEKYIYLDPTGMNLNPNADWTKPSSDPNKPNVYLGYIPSGQNTTTFSGGKYNDTLQCWQWELSTLNIANETNIFFTYTYVW